MLFALFDKASLPFPLGHKRLVTPLRHVPDKRAPDLATRLQCLRTGALAPQVALDCLPTLRGGREACIPEAGRARSRHAGHRDTGRVPSIVSTCRRRPTRATSYTIVHSGPSNDSAGWWSSRQFLHFITTPHRDSSPPPYSCRAGRDDGVRPRSRRACGIAGRGGSAAARRARPAGCGPATVYSRATPSLNSRPAPASCPRRRPATQAVARKQSASPAFLIGRIPVVCSEGWT